MAVDLSTVTGVIVASDLTTPILAVAVVISFGLSTLLAWRYVKRVFGGGSSSGMEDTWRDLALDGQAKENMRTKSGFRAWSRSH